MIRCSSTSCHLNWVHFSQLEFFFLFNLLFALGMQVLVLHFSNYHFQNSDADLMDQDNHYNSGTTHLYLISILSISRLILQQTILVEEVLTIDWTKFVFSLFKSSIIQNRRLYHWVDCQNFTNKNCF